MENIRPVKYLKNVRYVNNRNDNTFFKYFRD